VKVDFIPPIRDYELGLCVLWGGGAVYTVHSVFKRPVDFPPTVVTIHIRYCTLCEIIREKKWHIGTALECNAEDRRVDPARDYFFFCLRKATIYCQM
jgi:hypothetical protein